MRAFPERHETSEEPLNQAVWLLSDPVPQSPCANIRNERHRSRAHVAIAATGLETARAVGVVHEHRAAPEILARHQTPVSAVLRAVAVVAHHEVATGRDDDWSPIIERGLRRCRAESRFAKSQGLLPVEEWIGVI